MSITEIIEDVELKSENVYRHQVILFNDDFNTFYHVEECLITICLKDEREAIKIAREAHEKGKAVCYSGSMEECETVGEKLAEQDLTVSVQ